MIKFKQLRFKNAVTFDKTVSVPLEKQGRVFLLGKNKDTGGSNGAGKSTIWEVLQHVLFSSTSKGFSRNKFAAPGYMAELTMEVDGHDYKILQFRGAKKRERKDGYEIWKDGVDVTPKGTRHMQDCIQYIKEIIGITEEEFRGYIYLAQEGQGHVLISGTGSGKRNYLSNLFNLDRYDSVREGVEEELSFLNEKISLLSEKVAVKEEINNQLAEIGMNLEDFSAYEQSIKATRAFLENRYKIWDSSLKKEEVKRAKEKEREETKAKLNEIFPKWEEIDISDQSEARLRKLRKLNARIDKLEELKDLLSQKNALEENYVSSLEVNEEEAAENLKQSQATLAKIENELNGIKRRLILEEQLPNIDGIDDDVLHRLKDAEETLSVTKHNLAEAQNSLQKTAKLTEATCPTCGQALDQKAIEEQRKRAEKTVITLTSVLKNTKVEISALNNLVKKLETYEKLSAQLSELPKGSIEDKKNTLNVYEQQTQQLNSILEKAKDNSKIAKKLSEVVSAISSYPDNLDVSKIEEYKEKAKKLDKAIGKLETLKKLKNKFADMEKIELISDKNYEILVKKFKFYEKALSKLPKIEAEAEYKREQTEKLLNRLKAAEDGLEDWEHTQRRKSLFEAMKAAYGPKGLKILQLKKICNAICKTLPKYTTIMFQEPRVEFFVDNDPDSMDIEFYIRRFLPSGIEEYPVGKLSGGEKKRLAVAMIFSLSELVSPRKHCNLIVLDEVGDGLDPIGEEAFSCQLLPNLCQDTVICTSHRPGIEAAKFDKQWIVTKEENRSDLQIL